MFLSFQITKMHVYMHIEVASPHSRNQAVFYVEHSILQSILQFHSKQNASVCNISFLKGSCIPLLAYQLYCNPQSPRAFSHSSETVGDPGAPGHTNAVFRHTSPRSLCSLVFPHCIFLYLVSFCVSPFSSLCFLTVFLCIQSLSVFRHTSPRSLCFLVFPHCIFSCPGSSIPDLGH